MNGKHDCKILAIKSCHMVEWVSMIKSGHMVDICYKKLEFHPDSTVP